MDKIRSVICGQFRRVRAAACVALLLLCGCARAGLDAGIAEYADAEIAVSGLLDEEFAITPRDLAQLEHVSRSASGGSAKAGTVSAAGPTLATFLEQYGKSQADYELVRFIAADAYRVTLHEKTLAQREIIMAIAGGGGEPLPQSERPMRLLIPGLESNQWIYAVERIEFVETGEGA